MKRQKNRGFITLCLMGALLATGACGPTPETCAKCAAIDTAADEAAIRGVLGQIAEQFNAGNYAQMLALYREDVVVSAPGAPDLVGREAWRQALESTLPPGSGMRLRFDTQEISVAGDLAYERGTFAVELPDADGRLQQVAGGRHIHMFRREADGSWKGWRLFENSADPAPAAAPPPPQAAQP